MVLLSGPTVISIIGSVIVIVIVIIPSSPIIIVILTAISAAGPISGPITVLSLTASSISSLIDSWSILVFLPI